LTPPWARLARGLIDIIYPPRCLVCDAAGSEALCAGCIASILRGEAAEPACGPDLEAVAAVGRHEGALREAIHGLKYGRRRGLAVPLGHLLVRRLDATLAEWWPDLVIPVPMHWRARLRRGFNQSELLAEEVAASARLRHDRAALVKVRPTPSQVGLSGDQRRKSLHGAFSVRDPAVVRGRTLLLLDDVCTTGTTLQECARALRAAGAARIYGLILSSGERGASDSPDD
jgi:ComF family protein